MLPGAACWQGAACTGRQRSRMRGLAGCCAAIPPSIPCCRLPVRHLQEQSRILRRFRAGAINLLVSTAVAEEGIDVRSCQLVVRFDPPDTAQVPPGVAGVAGWWQGSSGLPLLNIHTHTAPPPPSPGHCTLNPSQLARAPPLPHPCCCPPQSYIQSRGRARMRNSELLFLVQQGRQEEVQVRRWAGWRAGEVSEWQPDTGRQEAAQPAEPGPPRPRAPTHPPTHAPSCPLSRCADGGAPSAVRGGAAPGGAAQHRAPAGGLGGRVAGKSGVHVARAPPALHANPTPPTLPYRILRPHPPNTGTRPLLTHAGGPAGRRAGAGGRDGGAARRADGSPDLRGARHRGQGVAGERAGV